MATIKRSTRTAPAAPAAAASGARKRSKSVKDVPQSNELRATLDALRKAMGDGTIIRANQVRPPFRIPTGVFEIDLALLGGIPKGRMTMAHGQKHSGKTTLADRITMGYQQTTNSEDEVAVKIDAEGTHDPVWAGKTGVDPDRLLVVQPDSGEQAVDAAVALAHTKEVGLIIIDSLAALMPMKELEADADKDLVAVQSKLITRALRKLTQAQITERKRGHTVTIFLINQQRTKIGGYAPNGIEPVSLPGGKALGHFTSVELRLTNKENVGKDSEGFDSLTHNDHAFRVEKNKLNGGMRTGEFRLIRTDGHVPGLTEGEIDDAPVMLSRAKALGWYTGGGGKFTLSFGDYELKGGSAASMAEQLYEDRETLWALRCHLIAQWASKQGMPDWYVNYILTGEETYD